MTKKKRIINTVIKATVFLLAAGVLLFRQHCFFAPQREYLKSLYPSGYDNWFWLQFDRLSMRSCGEIIMAAGAMYISYFLVNIFLFDASKKLRKRHLIAMRAPALITAGLAVAFYRTFDNAFMLSNHTYFVFLHLVIIQGIYYFTLPKPKDGER